MTTPVERFPYTELLHDELRERHWKPSQFVHASGLPASEADALLCGKSPLLAHEAEGIARAFGTSTSSWLRLDAGYREWREAQP